MSIITKIKIEIKFLIMKIKWKKKNKTNFTEPKHLCDINKIDIGDYTYGIIDAESFGANEAHLYIGSYCSIAQNVRFILDGEHYYHSLTTYPFKVMLYGNKTEARCKGPIIIGDDVWIGERAIILSGVSVGQGAIIGAGSIVTKNIPPYAIYAGNSIVKYRFKPELIDILTQVNLPKLVSRLDNKLDKLYQDISDFDKETLINYINEIENT